MPPKPKGKNKKSRGVTLSLSPMKRTKKAARHKQVSVPIAQELDKTLTEEEPTSGQVVDKIEMVMNILIDLSSGVQATEDLLKEMSEKMTTCMLSPAASCVD